MDLRFTSADARAAFAEELASAVAALAAKHHDERAPAGRRFRLLATIHPAVDPGKSAAAQPIPAAWARLVSRDGFAIEAEALHAGAAYAVTAATGDRFSGTIELYLPNREFFGTAAELDDGVFRLSMYPAGGRTGVTVWAATYGDGGREPWTVPSPAQAMRAFQQRAQATLEQLFA